MVKLYKHSHMYLTTFLFLTSFSAGVMITLSVSTNESILEGHHVLVCATFVASALPLQREIHVELVIPENYTGKKIFFAPLNIL